MSTQHTPGPWKARPGSAWVATECGCVADCRQTNNAERNVANARLIAAAPDLLAALEKAKETIFAFHGDVAWKEYQSSPEMRKINSAIKKATQL